MCGEAESEFEISPSTWIHLKLLFWWVMGFLQEMKEFPFLGKVHLVETRVRWLLTFHSRGLSQKFHYTHSWWLRWDSSPQLVMKLSTPLQLGMKHSPSVIWEICSLENPSAMIRPWWIWWGFVLARNLLALVLVAGFEEEVPRIVCRDCLPSDLEAWSRPW